MTIAQQLGVTKFPFRITNEAGNEIYWEDSEGFWVKVEYDDNENEIYSEDSQGRIIDRRPKHALISQLEEIVSRLEEDGLYSLQGIKDAITELKTKK